MPFVDRDQQGAIRAAFAAQQRPGQEFVADDAEEALAVTRPVRAIGYRDRRKAAYIAELGQDPTFENTVGDTLDTLIGQVEAMRAALSAERTAGFDTLLGKIAAIKARYPKG